MSEIILPGPDDPMIRQAQQAAQRDQQAFAMAKQIEMSVMITVFSQFAMAHSGKELTLEIGRAMAAEAGAISRQYSGFILESLGLATMTKNEPTVEALDQDQVDVMFDKR